MIKVMASDRVDSQREGVRAEGGAAPGYLTGISAGARRTAVPGRAAAG